MVTSFTAVHDVALRWKLRASPSGGPDGGGEDLLHQNGPVIQRLYDQMLRQNGSFPWAPVQTLAACTIFIHVKSGALISFIRCHIQVATTSGNLYAGSDAVTGIHCGNVAPSPGLSGRGVYQTQYAI